VADGCEAFLFLADRAQHIETLVKPALEEGKIVLCDRHTDSSVAYQGFGRGLDIERIKYLNNIAVNGTKPDLTIVFDVDTEIAQTRVGKNKDRLEKLGMEFHTKVKNGYLEIAKQEPERVKVVNANLSIDEVFAQVKILLDEALK
jgi:dTMP kinase